MNKAFLLICVLLSTAQLMLADKKSNKELFKEIQTSGNYVWGIGNAENEKEAALMALEDLVSNITVSVETSYDYLMISQQNNDVFNTTVDAKNMVKTYARMTLSNTQQIVFSNPKDKVHTVVKYISKDDLKEMFNKRGEKVLEYVKIARRAAKYGEISKALHNYYWALALLQSYPDGYDLKIEDDDFNAQFAYSWIPNQMRKLLKNIKISPQQAKIDADNEEKVVSVEVTFFGNPIDDVSFSCTDGNINETDILTTKDGLIDIFFPLDVKEKKLVANINYQGREEARATDPELLDVLEAASFLQFKEAQIKFGREIDFNTNKPNELAQQKPNEDETPTPEQDPAGIITSLQETSPVVEASSKSSSGSASFVPRNILGGNVTTDSEKVKKALEAAAETSLYSYDGETQNGMPDGTGVMTFKAKGTFDEIDVEPGDCLKGAFSEGHIYIASLYDANGNLKRKNIVGGM